MRILSVAATLLALALAEAADEPSVRPLPGNKRCPYPPKAQKTFVAGPVTFSVEVRPDGTAASVDVRKVPMGNVGFEDAVRECVSKWQFEPAPAGQTELRRHDGRIAFRLDPPKEAAIRALMEALAAAWNSGDMKAVEELALQPADAPGAQQAQGYLREQIQGDRPEPWRMELNAEVESIEFLGAELATVRQPYRRVSASALTGQATTGDEQTLQAIVAADPSGWRLLSVAPAARGGPAFVRVGSGRIREPRKIKDARPRYPDIAKQSRLQGVVILECLLSPDGKVRFVRILRGVVPVLDVAAVEAVRQWEYTPTLLDGRPVPVFLIVTVNFRLS